jgi:nondiscriminating aspartyl-tRNA synthetase
MERKLCELYPGDIVFVYEWPVSIKPFYIWPKDEKTSAGFDALYGGLEISSGGQRVHVPDVLIEQLKAKDLKPEDFKWYVDAFRYGAPMHSGWSIGLERLSMAMMEVDNVREVTLFPRDRKRLTP